MSCRCRLVVVAWFALVLSFFFCSGEAVTRPAASRPGQLPAAVNSPAQAHWPAGPLPQVAANYARLPMYFIANRGQVDKRVKYYVQGSGQTTYFTRDEIVLTLAKAGPRSEQVFSRKPGTGNGKLSVVRIKPVGLKKGVKLAALELTGHRVNYFRGNDPKKWRTAIPTYRAVVYENAYAGIDLKFYGQGRELEYDIVIKPGADPGQVRFAYQGVNKMELTPEGDLALVLPDGGRLLQKKPVVYQEMAGQRVPVEGKFRLSRRGAELSCGFAVAAYDSQRPLVIDPVLVYSTFLGGDFDNHGLALAVDASGAAYVTGWTWSSKFPTVQAYQGTYGGNSDAFVTKLNPAGNALVYSTYLGGGAVDYGNAIAVDASGAAYVTGVARSTNFPTHQAFQGTFGGGESDAFVTKLNPAGNALVYSTFLGGSFADLGNGIAVDASGAAYISGGTTSANFPTHQAFQGTFGGGTPGATYDAFVSKLSPAGNTLVYSTFLGGSGVDYGNGIAVDASGAAYVTGYTRSDNFPIYQAFQGTFGDGMQYAFVTKLNPAGNTLAYSTFLGGLSLNWGYGIAVDASGAAYVTGRTESADFPFYQAFQGTFGGGESDAFATKLSPAGNALAYSTYLGGSENDFGYAIAVDASGAAYVTGWTWSSNFPTYRASQGTLGGGSDAFVTKLSPAGNALAYSTFLGGSQIDSGCGIAVDASGAAYVTGRTDSADFPTCQAFQGTFKAFPECSDAFVTKLRDP